jgi:hypothetical protein
MQRKLNLPLLLSTLESLPANNVSRWMLRASSYKVHRVLFALPFGDLEAARLLAGNGEGEVVAQEHLGGEEGEGQGGCSCISSSSKATPRRCRPPP